MFFACVNTYVVECLLWLLFDSISLADYLPQELSWFGTQPFKGFGKIITCHPWFSI